MKKICSKCNLEKEQLDYYKSSLKKKWSQCISCIKKYREENKVKISINKKIYRENNQNKITQYSKIYYANTREENLKQQKEYRIKNKKFLNKTKANYSKNRKLIDPEYKLKCRLSKRINRALKKLQSSKDGSSILSELPYSFKQLKEHLENQFESWMNWQNWGIYNINTWNDNDSSTWTWNIDHIIPHCKFKYTSLQDQSFKDCWALSNLRPYSAKLNLIEQHRR